MEGSQSQRWICAALEDGQREGEREAGEGWMDVCQENDITLTVGFFVVCVCVCECDV